MKIAIVHDWLNQKVGGAESVLFELAKMYPEADIFTLVYDKKSMHYLVIEKFSAQGCNFSRALLKNDPSYCCHLLSLQ